MINKVLYRGKAKTVYISDIPNELIMEYRNDISAFDGIKLEKLNDKGMVNNLFNAFIMKYLSEHGVANHFVSLLDREKSIVQKLKMLPVECVVRNKTAGGICRRLGVASGINLDFPLLEFFLKNDELHDPMINEQHMLAFGWANMSEITQMQQISLRVNELLLPLFANCGIEIVDFKLEFGYNSENSLVVGDEITPDGCRLWDIATQISMDKDRFRKDQGEVIEYYKEVCQRLGIELL